MKIIILALLVIFALSINFHHADATVNPGAPKRSHKNADKVIGACFTDKLPQDVCEKLLILRVATIDTKSIIGQATAKCINAKESAKGKCAYFGQLLLANTDPKEAAAAVKAACAAGQISKKSCEAVNELYTTVQKGKRVETIGGACITGELDQDACGEIIASGAIKVDVQKIFIDGLKKCFIAVKSGAKLDKEAQETCKLSKRIVEHAAEDEAVEAATIAGLCEKGDIPKDVCSALKKLK